MISELSLAVRFVTFPHRGGVIPLRQHTGVGVTQPKDLCITLEGGCAPRGAEVPLLRRDPLVKSPLSCISQG